MSTILVMGTTRQPLTASIAVRLPVDLVERIDALGEQVNKPRSTVIKGLLQRSLPAETGEAA